MGRPSNGVPYLKGGVYHIRFQGDKGGGTSLNTTNARQAKQLGENLARKRGATMPSLVKGSDPAPRPPTAAPTVSASGVSGANALAGNADMLSGDALSGWLASDSEVQGSGAPDPSGKASASPSSSQTALAPSSSGVSLTADERSRMHGLLSGIVGRANVLALGLGVRIFGRIPAEPEPADMELLNKAWQLQLDELLGDKEIKPYMLIIGASAGLGIGMYMGGEPIPPKPSKGGAVATVTPLHSVP